MTSKVTIIADIQNKHDVAVFKGPAANILKPGEVMEFHLWNDSDLRIEELKNDENTGGS
jgi:hypothetical protein